MGMSLRDFCSCTPSEFEAIYKAWRECEDRKNHSSWEMTREIVMTYAQIHSKKLLDRKKVLPFPWDKVRNNKTNAQRSTKDRMETVLARLKNRKQDGK